MYSQADFAGCPRPAINKIIKGLETGESYATIQCICHAYTM